MNLFLGVMSALLWRQRVGWHIVSQIRLLIFFVPERHHTKNAQNGRFKPARSGVDEGGGVAERLYQFVKSCCQKRGSMMALSGIGIPSKVLDKTN